MEIARNVYICDACTFQQYLDTPLPGASWSRNASAGNNRLFLPDFGTTLPPEAPPGVATSLDLLPEIQGDEYQLIHTPIFDPFVLNGLAAMSLPPGWAYESEVLAADFAIGTPTGIASVYSVPNYWAWQEVIPVPEPSTGVLLGLGLAGLASGRRRSWFGTTVSERRFLLREGLPHGNP